MSASQGIRMKKPAGSGPISETETDPMVDQEYEFAIIVK